MKEISKFNKLMVLLFLAGIMAITSCEQPEEINPSPNVEDGSLNLEGIGQSSGIFSCGSDNVTLNGTIQLSGPALGQYCPAGRLSFTFCGGGPNMAFEGQFNSFIRPLTGGWFIGTIPLSQYNNSWSSMNITPKAGNVGAEPSENCSGYNPNPTPGNVVGFDGTLGSDNFGLGYYDYSLGNNIPNVTKAIVVWKGGTPTDPAGATDGYAIRVDALNAIGPRPGGPFTSQVIFDYREAL